VKRVVSGLRAWLLQRISALVMLVFMVCALLIFWIEPPRNYHQWHALTHKREVALVIGVFFAALLLHAWVGARDVSMDYVRPIALRIGVLAVFALALLAMALCLLRTLL
jgi:succinate dehydrogenase / fumarate reductase, membrane anchor subunit